MSVRDYDDFDVVITRDEGQLVARVAASPVGQAETLFVLPFTEEGLENLILKMGHSRSVRRRVGSPADQAARQFGDRLYRAVFAGDVETCLRRSLDQARRAGRGLRVRIRTSAVPALADVPWEYLYSESLGRFLTMSRDTPVVRYLDLAEPVEPLAVQPPLRMLVMVASPTDAEQLDVEREIALIRRATADLVADGRMSLTIHDRGDLAGLQRLLRTDSFHVLHFVGHGAFDRSRDDGVLLLAGSDGRGRPMTGRDLGVILNDHHSLRLVVLNACEGARGSVDDPFGGVAQSLLRQGIPATVAMQFEISDEAAINFAHEFYRALVDGLSIDAATVEGRKAIFAADHGVEWGTPVLHLRASDGVVFDVVAPTGHTLAAPGALPPVTAPIPASTQPPAGRGPDRAGLRWWAWAIAAVVVTSGIAVALAQLPDGDPASTVSPVPSAAAPTSDPSDVTKPTTPQSPDPTSDGSSLRFTVGVPSLLPPEGPSPDGSSGSGCPGDDELPDGIWFGRLLDKVGSDAVTFDPACFFFGDAAYAAAAEDGVAEVTNDYHIRDDSVATRTVVVSPRAVVHGIPSGDPSAGFVTIPWVSWPGGGDGFASCPGDFCLVWLYVNDGVVTEVLHQWVP